MARKKVKKYYNKSWSVKARLRSALYNIFFLLILFIFLKLFGISYLGSIAWVVICGLAYWLVGLLTGKK